MPLKPDPPKGNPEPVLEETPAGSQHLPNASQILVIESGNNVKDECLASLLGNAQVSWKSSREPLRAAPLQRLDDTTDQLVLTVRCGDGLAAVLATHESVPRLLRRYPLLRQGPISSWKSGFTFWGRLKSPIANAGSLSKCGIEVVQSGLISIPFDRGKMRAAVDKTGSLHAFDALDLSIDSESEHAVAPSPPVDKAKGTLPGDSNVAPEGGLRAAQIPGPLASEIRKLFGEAKVELVSSLDPTIPNMLKPQQACNVFAISCAKALGVVICKPEYLQEVESCYPALRQSTLTQWQGHYLHWVERVASPEEKPLVLSDHGVGIGGGAIFIGQGLIPVAIDRPGGELFLVRPGTLRQIRLTEPLKEKTNSGSGAPLGGIPPEPFGPVADAMEAREPKSPKTASACSELLQKEMLNDTPAVQAIRHRLGPGVPLKICAAYQKDIPPVLRGFSAHNVQSYWGPPDDLIAVDLGEGSGNLAVVGCQSPKDLTWFRQANPDLQICLVTLWNQWALLWLRTDARPENVMVGQDWIWLTRAAIPVSWPGQLEALIHVDGPAVQVSLATLKWPEVLSEAFRVSRLEEEYGSCFRRCRGKTLLRESFWSNWLAEILDVAYYPKLREFRTQSNHATERLSDALMFSFVREMLQKAANSMPDTFPISEIKPCRIRQLIRLLKAVARVPQVEPAAVKPYCLARLKSQLGATLTTNEIWLDYLAYCKRHDQPSYTKGQFLRILPAVIREVFGLTKSHDIKREGRPKRGFRGLGLSSASPADQSEQITASKTNLP